MKRILLTLALCAAGTMAYGQGNVAVSTYAKDAYVRFSNTVAGAWATGNSTVIWGLYYGDSAATTTKILTSSTFGFGSGGFAGYINAASSGGSTTRTIPDMNAGQTAYFQLKAWSAGFDSWEACMATGDPTKLVSDPKRVLAASEVLVSTVGTPAPPVPTVIKWNPGAAAASAAIVVDLVPVPEPSIIALAGLGLAGLIFIRRRK